MGGYLKTQNMLQTWEINAQILEVCSLCNQIAYSHQHLFFECSFATQVWFVVRALAKMDGVNCF